MERTANRIDETGPDLAAHDDINPAVPITSALATTSQFTEVVVVLARCSGGLARVFGLLCTFSLLPTSSRTVLDDDRTIKLTLEFHDTTTHQLDLLQRKLSQLTEVVNVSFEATDCPKITQ